MKEQANAQHSTSNTQLPKMFESFFELNRMSVDEEGIKIPHCLHEKDGQITASALAIAPTEVYEYIARILVRERPESLVFGLDRYVLNGQGIDTDDVMSVSLWAAGRWRFGIIPYTFSPSRFGPVIWDNTQFNAMLAKEMTSAWKRISNAPHREPSPAMALPLVIQSEPS